LNITVNCLCFFNQKHTKGSTNPVDEIDRARRTAQPHLFGEPQFICGARAAAPGAGVPFLKSRLRLFKHLLISRYWYIEKKNNATATYAKKSNSELKIISALPIRKP
jgi:hypothetical protein